MGCAIDGLRLRTPLGGTPGLSTDWRLLINSVATPGNTAVIREMEMRATVRGVDQCVGGTAFASSVGGGQVASLAFDDDRASSFWSSGSATMPQYLGYTFPAPVPVQQIVLTGYSGTGAPNAPANVDVQYFDGSVWQTYWSIPVLGSWVVDETKYADINGEVWFADNLNAAPGNTSYTDNTSVMGTHVTPTASVVIEGLTAYHRAQAGTTYEAVIYEVNSSTGAFISEVVVSPARSYPSAVTGEQHYVFTAPVTLASGTRYAIGIRRTDGSDTSNADMHYYNGTNSFEQAPLTINGVWGIAKKTTPTVGQLPSAFNTSAIVWTVGVIYRAI